MLPAAPPKPLTLIDRIQDRFPDFDPAPDLGSRIGSVEWFRGVATCAGLILLSKRIASGAERGGQPTLGLLDVSVVRNGFGRQLDSFEADLQVKGFDAPLRAIFIRAPIIYDVGPGVDVLSTVDDKVVMVQQGKLLAAAFHPELLSDDRIHAHFLDAVVEH